MARFHVINLFNEPFFVDPDDSLGLCANGVYEPYESSLIRAAVKGKKCLDIGAHIGYTTRLMIDAGAEGVMAFEPNPLNYGFLVANTNHLPNVGRFNHGLGSTTSNRVMFLSPINSGDDAVRVLDESKFVPVLTSFWEFDDLNQFGICYDFVKIDVQGWELYVLQGMKQQLTNGHPMTIALEYYGDGMHAAGIEGRDLLTFLWKYGYKLSEICEGEKQLVPITDLLFCDREDLKHGYTNILATRE